MHLYFRYFLIFCTVSSCTAQKNEADSFGTQSILILVTMGQDTSRMVPFEPPHVLLYYGGFLIERALAEKQTSINGIQQPAHYDTSYYFIDLKKRTYIKFKEFAPQAAGSGLSDLNKKPSGIDFGSQPDVSFYIKDLPLKDTVINGSSFKLLTMHSSKPPREESVYYLDNRLPYPLFHLDKRIDDEFKATVVRIDVNHKDAGDRASIRMTVNPGNLTEDQIAVFKSWINYNKNLSP